MIPGSVLVAGIISFLASLAISAALVPIVRRWALKHQFVDNPSVGDHKSHVQPTPFGGGVAIVAAVLIPMAGVLIGAWILKNPPARLAELLTAWTPKWPYLFGGVAKKTTAAIAIMAGAVLLHIVGLIDDRRPLSVRLKFVCQIIVALLLTAVFGIRSAEALGAVPAVLISTLWIVVLTNAFNFMDNMDGLSAGVALIAAVVLAVSAFLAGQVFVPCLLLLIAGALVGFLIYNFPPASIFMGDAGSMVVGYLLAVCTILTTFYNPDQQRKPFGVLVPLLVFAIPLYDTISVVIHRYRLKVNIFKGDRRHFSHRLARLGLSPTSTVLTVYLATSATALPAILLPLVNWPIAAVIFGQCLCVIAIIAILESRHA